MVWPTEHAMNSNSNFDLANGNNGCFLIICVSGGQCPVTSHGEARKIQSYHESHKVQYAMLHYVTLSNFETEMHSSTTLNEHRVSIIHNLATRTSFKSMQLWFCPFQHLKRTQ